MRTSLFRAMVLEEWRLHARLFGGTRFAAFPLFIAAVVVGTVAVLTETGTDLGSVLAGLHALALVFGLQTGTIGFMGSDRLDSLLGDVTLLLSVTRSLPVSPRRVFAIFLVKDVLYYAGLFLVPIALAVWLYGLVADLPTLGSRAPLLVVTLAGTFVLGLATTLALIGLARRGTPGRLVAFGAAAGVGLAWVAGLDVSAWTPYGLYADPSLARAATGFAPVPLLLGIGWALFDASHARAERTATARFAAWHDRLPSDPRGLATRNLLEIHRSGGGFAKPVVSSALITGVAVALLSLAGRITGVEPNAPVTLGALLGLSAFTTYNWLTQFDSATEYRIYPVSTQEVFRAKRDGFLVLTLPVGVLLYVAVVLWFGGSLLSVVSGALLFCGLALYLFGLTVFLAGLDPNTFLFDTLLFGLFAVAVAVPLVPVIVVGLVVPVSTIITVAIAVGSLVLAGAGHLLYGRAVPRWTQRLAAE